MPPIEFHSKARQDFDESLRWYAGKSVETAARFIASVDVTLVMIAENSRQFCNSGETHHEWPLKKFPFRVVYRVIDDRILIVAIAHTRRRPSYWRDRT